MICFQAWQYAGRVVGFVCQEWMHCSSHATEPYGRTKRKKNETKSSDRQWDGCIGNEQRGLQQLTSEKHIGPRKLMHYACSLGEKRFLSQNFSLMLRACQVTLSNTRACTKLPLAGQVLSSSRILGQKKNEIVALKLKWKQ